MINIGYELIFGIRKIVERGSIAMFFCHSFSDHDPHEDLANFGYEINMKIIIKKSFYIFGYLLEPCVEIE
jgi:hypothetical protein